MLLVCPRCGGSLPPDARACPRCGLLLTNNAPAAEQVAEMAPLNGRDAYPTTDVPVEVGETSPAAYIAESTMAGSGTAPYTPADIPSYGVPVRPRQQSPSPETSTALPQTSSAALLVPRGAVELLPNESVVFQLGALYLTSKRVILLAPTVLRTAFLRDVDAVGTLTERASGWNVFIGLLLLGLAGVAIFFSFDTAAYQALADPLRVLDPRIVAVAAALIAIYMFVNYFFWIKRTLFLSVSGRPLITVSVTDWNARKLEGVDQFVNTFSQVKDSINGDERLP